VKQREVELSRSERKNPTRAGVGVSRILLCLLLALVALSLCSRTSSASAITQAQISSANGGIQSAFASVYGAEKSGGNVSSLDAKLNDAIQLVQKAVGENATSPTQAATDLQNATALAQGVIAESPSVSQAGSASRQTTEITSLGAASAIVVVAALTYIFGGRIYRMAWLRLHKDYVVRPANG
jgi:hypothetical protein